MKVTAIIPAHNEEKRIGNVVKKTKEYVDEVLVIDDASEDNTKKEAENYGARVLRFEKNRGYISAIKEGFRKAEGDVLITIDGDGEHDPSEIPKLLKEIEEGYDLVLGKRERIDRVSERILNLLVNFKVKCKDSGTGFRAIKKELALKLEIRGKCTCGILVLEAYKHNAKIKEVPIKIRKVDKKRKIAFFHFYQFFYVLRELI
ncbi:MAG TPA: glycosyltransferase family 2 protein [Methanomicrobia archaeon]|nr:glycosyltransferase family 2 protein [Methanomicrobia archaeon]